MASMEGLGNIWGRELDDHVLLALAGIFGVTETALWVTAETAAGFANRREDGGDERGRFEVESHEVAVGKALLEQRVLLGELERTWLAARRPCGHDQWETLPSRPILPPTRQTSCP